MASLSNRLVALVGLPAELSAVAYGTGQGCFRVRGVAGFQSEELAHMYRYPNDVHASSKKTALKSKLVYFVRIKYY